MRFWTPLAAAAAVATAAVVVAAGPSTPATAGNGTTNYTHSTTLKTSHCTIHANYPKPGVPDWGWTKTRRSPRGALYHVGVRYTYKGYALVLDYARHGEPSWGFIPKSCLLDWHAYDAAGHPLPDLRAIGGNGQTKDVLMSARHTGKVKRTELHGGAHLAGSLRNAAKPFVIGNARAGAPFWTPPPHCGPRSRQAWILGYAPRSGRWGYVQARTLPACH